MRDDIQDLLKGKTAVVTGGSRGIGLAITKAFVEAGARVAIIGRGADALEQAAAEVGAAVLPLQADIGDPDDVRAAFAKVDEAFDGLDILINNAGIFPLYRIEEAGDEEIQTTFSTNIIGPLFCIRSAIPLMRKRGGGDIISVSSESVRNPFPFLTTYAATKAALETLSQGLRAELAEDGIRTAVLRSGHVKSGEVTGGRWDPERAKAFFELANRTGHMAMAGAGIEPETTARMVLTMVTQPRNATVDIVELRSR